MFDPCQHPSALRALYYLALGRAFLRHRDPGRRAIGVHQVEFYDRVWREAAERLGASFAPLGAGISEIRLNGVKVRVVENTCPIDDFATMKLAGNKPFTYRLLRQHGLPTPRFAEFSLGAMGPAVEFLGAGRADRVVKPAAGTGGGRGVTTGVRSRTHLARAAAVASVYGDELLIEEQMTGDNYRLLYLDGRLVDAFVRRPPSVVADGRSTVGALVRVSNEARLRYGTGLSQVLLTADLDMERTLARQGLTLGSTPGAGTVVTVKTVVNENCGSDNTSAGHVLCPAVVTAGARAALALGVRLAGVDVITPDPGAALEDVGGAILEVNSPPNYYYHYHKRDGAFPVAILVLQRLLSGCEPPGEGGPTRHPVPSDQPHEVTP